MKRYLLSIILCLCASCAWAFPPGFIGVVVSGGAAPTGYTELLTLRFESNAIGWAGKTPGNITYVSPFVADWDNGSGVYGGAVSQPSTNAITISAGDEITVSFTASNRQGTTKFYLSSDDGGSVFGGSSVQEYVADGDVTYTFTSNASSSSVILVFYSGTTSTLSGSRIASVSVRKAL